MAARNSTDSLKINVCYQELTKSVTVADDTSVASFLPIVITSMLDKNVQVPTGKYRIIYAGSILKNDMLLKDLRLRTASVLHLINTDTKKHFSLKNLNNEPEYSQFNYYVYCYECKDISSAKLSVKCHQCQQFNRFYINKNHEPKCREDILAQEDNIPGNCNSPGCTGTSAQFKFVCQTHPTKNAVLLKHVFNNCHHQRCITCEEDLTPILVYPCQKRHTMCLDCFKIYCVQYLTEFKFCLTDQYGYTIKCPDHCDQSFIQEVHHFRILGNNKYEEYKTRGTNALLQNMDTVCCPNPECNECFEADLSLTNVTCLKCRNQFCRQCSSGTHHGPCSRMPVEGIDMLSEGLLVQQTECLISKISKKCPKCGINVEKNGGCNHMSCKCNAEWCWLCGKIWSNACLEKHWFD